MKTRRDKLDALYSQLIREANNYTCQACGKYHVEGERQGLHASHFPSCESFFFT
jgi:hypothetical protein